MTHAWPAPAKEPLMLCTLAITTPRCSMEVDRLRPRHLRSYGEPRYSLTVLIDRRLQRRDCGLRLSSPDLPRDSSRPHRLRSSNSHFERSLRSPSESDDLDTILDVVQKEMHNDCASNGFHAITSTIVLFFLYPRFLPRFPPS